MEAKKHRNATCVEIPIEDEEKLQDLAEKAKDFALMHGICMRKKDAFDRDSLHFAPFLLFPSPFPRSEFDRVVRLQTTLNLLTHRVAHDRRFLEETLAKTIQVDPFTAKLHQIFQTVWNEGLTQVGDKKYST